MNIADLNRRIESLIRLGTIAQVDHAARKLRVQTGGLLTGWLPWPAEVGRNYRRWRPLRTGTQVILACPSGDPAQAVVVQILYTTALDAPSTDPDIDLIEFDDGTLIHYDSAAHRLSIDVHGDASVQVEGDATLMVGGDLAATVEGVATLDATHIALNQGTGVVTGECICPFTGKPHADISTTVTAGK
jgi:phage baseplate assembly protein V